jgi:hypothetical protein
MSDFDSLLERLRGQAPPAPFAPAAAVRRRGRQRATRQAVAVGAAVLVAVGLGAGSAVAVLAPADPPPASSPTAVAPPPPQPTLTEIPDRWLLTWEDLGEGWEPTSHELFESDPPWYWGDLCDEYRDENYPSLRHRLAFSAISWRNDEPSLPGRVDQVVELFGPGAGATNLDDVRAVLTLCSRRPAAADQADEVAPTYFEVEETGFAGDESLLIAVEPYHFDDQDDIVPAGHRRYAVVVRVGDVVSTTIYGDSYGADQARELAQRAADRLG